MTHAMIACVLLCFQSVSTSVLKFHALPARVAPLHVRAAILSLRGGADELDEDLEGDEDTAAGLENDTAGLALENPFLGAGGTPLEGGSLQDLAQSLKDPKLMQEAL